MTALPPFFSVVVNTTDRARSLHTLLRALEMQSYPNFEVVVVVGPTRDDTLDVLRAYEGRVRVLRCPSANLSRSRNIGILASRGEFVAFIDDDAVPCQRWLEQLARLFEDPALDGTGGTVYWVHPAQPVVQFRLGTVSSLSEHIDVRHSWLDRLVPEGDGCQWIPRMMGTNMAFRRQALLEVGGFDEFYIYISDETDLMLRLCNSGKILRPVKEAVVYHNPASSRNRTIFTHRGRWWMNTRSMAYFGIKNGRDAGDAQRTILKHCAQLAHGHWLWFVELKRRGQLNWPQFLQAGFMEALALANAVFSGLLTPRKLIRSASIQPHPETNPPPWRFQHEASVRQPAVDPVSGYQPSITMSEPPLRICLLSGNYPPVNHDGVARQTNLLARGLFERGHTVHVIARGESDQVSFYDGAFVHRLATRLDRYERYRLLPEMHHLLNHSHRVCETVKRLKLNDGIQIVDSSNWHFEGLVTAVSGGTPVVVRLVTSIRQISQMTGEKGLDSYLQGEMEKAIIEKADHLLPNTRATMNTIQKVYGLQVAGDRYSLAPYGIVPVPDEDARPFDTRRSASDLLVLFLGRLEKRKGIMDLFQAIPAVIAQVPQARFVIAGGDSSDFDGFKKRTGLDYPAYFAKHYARYAPRVQFVGEVEGDSPQHRSLYQSCDVFVAPSLYESFGLIYPEAMNYAKPVIGCKIGGVPEVVEDGVTGILVEPESPPMLSDALISLLKSPSKMREMGLAGRQRLLDRFTYLAMAGNFERIYRRVIAQFDGQPESTPIAGG